jgi:hypothetical protein
MTDENSKQRRNKFPLGNRASQGRPRKTATPDEMIAIAAPAILERAIAAALAGDMAAAAIVLGMAGRKIDR